MCVFNCFILKSETGSSERAYFFLKSWVHLARSRRAWVAETLHGRMSGQMSLCRTWHPGRACHAVGQEAALHGCSSGPQGQRVQRSQTGRWPLSLLSQEEPSSPGRTSPRKSLGSLPRRGLRVGTTGRQAVWAEAGSLSTVPGHVLAGLAQTGHLLAAAASPCCLGEQRAHAAIYSLLS